MFRILSQINALQIQFLHEKYAEATISFIKGKLETVDKLEVSDFVENENKGRVLSFEEKEPENIRIELRYINQMFVLVIFTQFKNNNPRFIYTISNESKLHSLIPEKVKKAMTLSH